MQRAEMGRRGEEAAARYLEETLGWQVTERNLRIAGKEIDLVCTDGDELVFVEVRTRKAGWMQPAATTVGPRKLRRLCTAAGAYVERLRWRGNWRIDLLALTVKEEHRCTLRHIRDITGEAGP
ncbi:MAG: YraN family protein [Synergistales bacterium]|nr:YraN family protein [Synergistales bacterium]